MKFSNTYSLILTLVLAFTSVSHSQAKDDREEYLLTASRANELYLIDIDKLQIARAFPIPGPGAPLHIVASPDGEIAYVIMNGNASISGINLSTGEEVFRLDLANNYGNVRAKSNAMAISRDGSKLFLYEIPMRRLQDRYRVLDSRISVYSTAEKRPSKPLSQYKVPRRINNIMFSSDGEKLYAVGQDIYTLDPASGELLDVYPVTNWKRENYYPPDFNNPFMSSEQSDIYATPIYAVRSDIPLDDYKAYETLILTLDLKSGEFETQPFENTVEGVFDIVVSPNGKEAFGGWNSLAKIDLDSYTTVNRVALDHSYYMVNISGDGEKVVVGGGMCDITVYSSSDLSKIGKIEIPGCPDMVFSSIRFVSR